MRVYRSNMSQKERIIRKVTTDGFVTRNEALRNYITRLGAIIHKLQQEGWKFKTVDTGRDYRYELVEKPQQTLFQ